MEDKTVKQVYEYNCMNRLASSRNDTGLASIYTYNGLGQRVAKKQFSDITISSMGSFLALTENLTPAKSTEYLLDQTKRTNNLLLLLEEDSVREYVWDGTVACEKQKEKVHYYLSDEMGSPLRYMDQNGGIIESYSYDEFGNDVVIDNVVENNKKSQPFGYAGYSRDPVSGMYFAQAREYDQRVSRFTAGSSR